MAASPPNHGWSRTTIQGKVKKMANNSVGIKRQIKAAIDAERPDTGYIIQLLQRYDDLNPAGPSSGASSSKNPHSIDHELIKDSDLLYTPLQYAVAKGKKTVVEILVRHGAKVENEFTEDFFKYAVPKLRCGYELIAVAKLPKLEEIQRHRSGRYGFYIINTTREYVFIGADNRLYEGRLPLEVDPGNLADIMACGCVSQHPVSQSPLIQAMDFCQSVLRGDPKFDTRSKLEAKKRDLRKYFFDMRAQIKALAEGATTSEQRQHIESIYDEAAVFFHKLGKESSYLNWKEEFKTLSANFLSQIASLSSKTLMQKTATKITCFSADNPAQAQIYKIEANGKEMQGHEAINFVVEQLNNGNHEETIPHSMKEALYIEVCKFARGDRAAEEFPAFLNHCVVTMELPHKSWGVLQKLYSQWDIAKLPRPVKLENLKIFKQDALVDFLLHFFSSTAVISPDTPEHELLSLLAYVLDTPLSMAELPALHLEGDLAANIQSVKAWLLDCCAINKEKVEEEGVIFLSEGNISPWEKFSRILSSEDESGDEDRSEDLSFEELSWEEEDGARDPLLNTNTKLAPPPPSLQGRLLGGTATISAFDDYSGNLGITASITPSVSPSGPIFLPGSDITTVDISGLSSLYYAAQKVYGQLNDPWLMSLPMKRLLEKLRRFETDSTLLNGKTIWQTLNPEGDNKFQVRWLVGSAEPLIEGTLAGNIKAHEARQREYTVPLADVGGIYRPTGKKYYFKRTNQDLIDLFFELRPGETLTPEEMSEATHQLVVICQDVFNKMDVNIRVYDSLVPREKEPTQKEKLLKTIVTTLCNEPQVKLAPVDKVKTEDRAIQKEVCVLKEKMADPAPEFRNIDTQTQDLAEVPFEKQAQTLHKKSYRLMTENGRRLPEMDEIARDKKNELRCEYWAQISQWEKQKGWRGVVGAVDILANVLINGDQPERLKKDGLYAHVMPLAESQFLSFKEEVQQRRQEWVAWEPKREVERRPVRGSSQQDSDSEFSRDENWERTMEGLPDGYGDEDDFLAIEQATADSIGTAADLPPVHGKTIPGFGIGHADDDGCCFYHALVTQTEILGKERSSKTENESHQLFFKILAKQRGSRTLGGVEPHKFFRGEVEGEENRESRRQVDINVDFKLICEKLGIVIAIINTAPDAYSDGFRCYYSEGGALREVWDNPGVVPQDKPIIRLAFNGDHFMPVLWHPPLEKGALRDAYRPELPPGIRLSVPVKNDALLRAAADGTKAGLSRLTSSEPTLSSRSTSLSLSGSSMAFLHRPKKLIPGSKTHTPKHDTKITVGLSSVPS